MIEVYYFEPDRNVALLFITKDKYKWSNWGFLEVKGNRQVDPSKYIKLFEMEE
jgi:acyl-CoA-binding protein